MPAICSEYKWYGVDIERASICDTYERGVWEPVTSKINSLASATEAACLILTVDETVKNPASEREPGQGPRRPPGGAMGGAGLGRGAPMSAAMGGAGMRSMMGGRGVRVMQGRGGK